MNSYAMLTEPSLERNGKRNDEGSSECVVGFLRSRLALSSRKLLLQDPCKEDGDKGNKNRVNLGSLPICFSMFMLPNSFPHAFRVI